MISTKLGLRLWVTGRFTGGLQIGDIWARGGVSSGISASEGSSSGISLKGGSSSGISIGSSSGLGSGVGSGSGSGVGSAGSSDRSPSLITTSGDVSTGSTGFSSAAPQLFLLHHSPFQSPRYYSTHLHIAVLFWLPL